MKSLFLTCFFFLLGITLSISQNRQGNIVEYFGKEKVEEIREGKVIHVFKEGLLWGTRRFGFNSSTTPKDPVFSKILLNPENFDPSEGWEKITVNDKNEFNNGRLRSGYLYLEYQSDSEAIVLFEASGHTRALINGLPYEGDHYDYGWSLIPVKLKKGKNTLILQGGRFPRMRARLLQPHHPVQLTTRDMTLPDLLIEDNQPIWGAIRVINATDSWFSGGAINLEIGEKSTTFLTQSISPMTIMKQRFMIINPSGYEGNTVKGVVKLLDKNENILSVDTIQLRIKSVHKHHKRTFISDIDNSVQYYSVAPASDPEIQDPALFLSVHGASVEAVNQANAYKQKEWGHLVAPTNRRPFGFAWEDWGRLDALEVLEHAEKLLSTNPSRTYLTGHSMGGHGTWYLGATYPDRFAAIAPCAGYPDLLSYRNSFSRRLRSMSDDDLKRFNMTREQANRMSAKPTFSSQVDQAMDSITRRAGNPSRTLNLKRNYLHHGVFILHGEKDNVVPTFLAREMRETLGKYHPDFTYYEYPNGTHWYGNHSVDWPPIFDFFKAREIKKSSEIEKFEFHTASPGVSASTHFVTINQQQTPFDFSSVDFQRDSIPLFSTHNVSALTIDMKKMGGVRDIIVDERKIKSEDFQNKIYLKQINGTWQTIEDISLKEKGPHRNGGFKDAFRNNVVFVYATQGTNEENQWYYNKARFDATTFWYRANGSIEIVKDTEFSRFRYADRNVILYGNQDNNAAWNELLKWCPIRVSNNQLTIGHKTLSGEQWGIYFIYPRIDSDTACVGVVSGTGSIGMKAAYNNHYLVNGTTFPDLMIFDEDVLKEGISGVHCSGFLGNDWSVEKGDFVWR